MLRRLAIVGALPPPFGGVSVHIARLRSLLEDAGIDYVVYEQTGRPFPGDASVSPIVRSPLGFLKFLTTVREPVLHLHFHNRWALGFAMSVLRNRRNTRYILTAHSRDIAAQWYRMGRLERAIAAGNLRNAHHIVCVNRALRDFFCHEVGLTDDRVSVIPAFLPPSAEESREENIPTSLRDFLARHRVVVGSHAWFGGFTGGEHVYGLEALAALVREIAVTDPAIGVYTVISGTYDAKHREKVLRMQRDVAQTWYINEEPFATPSLFKHTDIFVRPTASDGDSMSVRECLYYGAQVLASDVVPRPQGCALYRFGDQGELSQRFWSLVANQRSCGLNSAPGVGREFGERLLSVLRGALDS